MTNEDLSKELWNITNIVTGFAVFQTIAFTYACAKPDFSDMINTPVAKITITIMISFATVLECFAVWWCTRQQMSLLADVNHQQENENIEQNRVMKIIDRIGWGRMICIIFLMIPFIISLYAPQLRGRTYRNPIIHSNSIQTGTLTSPH